MSTDGEGDESESRRERESSREGVRAGSDADSLS